MASSTLPSAAKAVPRMTIASIESGSCFEDLAALGSRFAGISVGQQSIGQAETCSRQGGDQPNGLAPLDDGSIELGLGERAHRPTEHETSAPAGKTRTACS